MRERVGIQGPEDGDVFPLRPAPKKGGVFTFARIVGLIALIAVAAIAAVLFNIFGTHTIPGAKTSTDQSTVASSGAPSIDPSMARIPGNKAADVTPVVTSMAIVKVLPLELHNIGNVDAFSIVNVIAQVGGQLTDVFFKQGQDVKKGELLFRIDPRPFQAQLGQAEANVNRDSSQIKSASANLAKDVAAEQQTEAAMKRDKASLQYADVEVERYRRLVQEGAVSHEQSDQIKTNSDTAGATVQSDQAMIDNAKAVVDSDKAAVQTAKATLAADQNVADNLRVQLGWTEIRSPINGVIGALNVYQGNVVRANDTTPLVTINQIQPIYVTFAVPEAHLSEIRVAQASGTLSVSVRVGGDKKQTENGTLTFIDNQVDKTTGTIRLRATFLNANRNLWPGQFVDVVLDLPGAKPEVVIPTRAIQNGQQGTCVYVVNPANNTVTFVPIEVERNFGDNAVVSKGLKNGDQIVVDGQMKLSPGAKVKPGNAQGNAAQPQTDSVAM
jgi:membrane fusion protein, multidrug efflux system